MLFCNSKNFFQENAFENILCKMTAILSWPPCGNSFTLGNMVMILKLNPHIIWIKFMSNSCEIDLSWMAQNTLMKCQHWFRRWLGAVRQQAITWANVDPDPGLHGVTRPQWVNGCNVIYMLALFDSIIADDLEPFLRHSISNHHDDVCQMADIMWVTM